MRCVRAGVHGRYAGPVTAQAGQPWLAPERTDVREDGNRTGHTGHMQRDPALYPWFVHREMLDALLGDGASGVERSTRRDRLRGRDANSYAAELETWRVRLARTQPRLSGSAQAPAAVTPSRSAR